MKYIVAVSGGVDSVVLLHMLIQKGKRDVIVAHFDHGIRPDSAADARFVKGLAENHALPFSEARVELGAGASEEQARTARYAFLRELSEQNDAQIVTAHHAGDVLETIAINLTRGTGWRGLAAMNDQSIHRPLLQWSKHQLYEYALSHNLEWVEDETNQSHHYLRNRIRKKTARLSNDVKSEVVQLRDKQVALARAIDTEASELMNTSRYLYIMADEHTASEVLRAYLLLCHSVSLTRLQRQKFLLAIKTFKPGSTFEPGGGIIVHFTKRDFIVKHLL